MLENKIHLNGEKYTGKIVKSQIQNLHYLCLLMYKYVQFLELETDKKIYHVETCKNI